MADDGTHLGVPHSFVMFWSSRSVMWVVLHRSVFGRYLFAVGKNEEAARYSGIHTQPRHRRRLRHLRRPDRRCRAIFFAMYTHSISPSSHGNFYELYAIAAAVLGGCSLRGGEGSIVGIVLGADPAAGPAEPGEPAGHPELAQLRRHGHGDPDRRARRPAAHAPARSPERTLARLAAAGPAGRHRDERHLCSAPLRTGKAAPSAYMLGVAGVCRQERKMQTYKKTQEAVAKLSPEQYRVTQQSATERPGTGALSAQQGARHLRRHRVGRAAVRVVRQVRIGLRLAELHQADRARQRQRTDGRHARHGPHRGALEARRQPSRPRLPRRSDAIAAGCATASIRPRCGSSIATTWRPKATVPISTRWRTCDEHRNAQCWPAAASGACRT